MHTTEVQPPPVSIPWTPAFALGIPEADEEHQTVVALYNDLVHALQRGATPAMNQSAIPSLQRFMTDHRSREEAYIQRHAFPSAAHHIGERREFAAVVSALSSGQTVASVVALLRACILNHRLLRDRTFVRACDARARPGGVPVGQPLRS